MDINTGEFNQNFTPLQNVFNEFTTSTTDNNTSTTNTQFVQEQQIQSQIINLLLEWGFSDLINTFQYHKIEMEHLHMLNDAFLIYILQGWPANRILDFKVKLTEFVRTFNYLKK